MKKYLLAFGCCLIISICSLSLQAQSWNIVGSAGFSAAEANYTSIAIDSSGTPYVFFEDQANGYKASVMKYNGTSWVYIGTPGFSTAGLTSSEGLSIAIDPNGIPYVAFEDSAHSKKATVMKYNGSSWVIVGTPGFSAGVILLISLAIDGSGTPYIAYPDAGYSGKATMMKYNGSSWVSVGSPGFTYEAVNFLTMAIDTGGTPYVTYQDESAAPPHKATTMKYSGGSWVYVGSPDFTGGEAWFTSIAIDKNGTPYVAYWDESVTAKASVMKYNGSSWIYVGSPGFSTGDVQDVQIAIDKNGTPYVLYLEGSPTLKTTVMTFNGSSWVDAGSAGFSAGGADNPSMAVDGSGTPFVAYMDEANSYKATVMRLGTLPSPITGASTICTGASATLTDITSSGTWSSSNTSIATVDIVLGTLGGISAGTAIISYTTTGGTTTFDVTVLSLPSTGTITGGPTVCAGATTALTDGTGSGVWSSSNTSIATVSASGIVDGIATGDANISYAVTNSCGTTSTYSVVTVNSLPSAGTISGTTTLCAGTSIILSDGASGGVWSSSNTGVATVSASGDLDGVTGGIANISYEVTNSCGTTTTYLGITVTPLPSAGTISGTTLTCLGSTTTLSDGVGGGIWSSSNTTIATVSSSGVVYGVATGTADITYSVTNSCGTATTYSAITVSAVATAGTISGTTTVCEGAAISLSDGVGGGVWSSSNTSSATVDASGTVYGIATGTSNIIYTITSSCGTATATTTITVNPLPVAGSISGSSVLCAGASIILTDGTAGGTWSSDNTAIATVSSTGTVSGVTAGGATISYSVTNSCGVALATQMITVTSCTTKIQNIPGQTPNITIFPSPATNELTITSTANITTISINNLIGQTFYTHCYNVRQIQIDVSNLLSGIYFVRINDTEVRKFVKQ